MYIRKPSLSFPSLQASYFHVEVKTVRKNTYETNKISLNYLNMTTIQSSTCEHHWVCAIATLTINAEGDRL